MWSVPGVGRRAAAVCPYHVRPWGLKTWGCLVETWNQTLSGKGPKWGARPQAHRPYRDVAKDLAAASGGSTTAWSISTLTPVFYLLLLRKVVPSCFFHSLLHVRLRKLKLGNKLLNAGKQSPPVLVLACVVCGFPAHWADCCLLKTAYSMPALQSKSELHLMIIL